MLSLILIFTLLLSDTISEIMLAPQSLSNASSRLLFSFSLIFSSCRTKVSYSSLIHSEYLVAREANTKNTTAGTQKIGTRFCLQLLRSNYSRTEWNHWTYYVLCRRNRTCTIIYKLRTVLQADSFRSPSNRTRDDGMNFNFTGRATTTTTTYIKTRTREQDQWTSMMSLTTRVAERRES